MASSESKKALADVGTTTVTESIREKEDEESNASDLPRRLSSLSSPERNHVLACCASKRRLDADSDVTAVGGAMGGNWRAVANLLLFNHAQIDQFEDGYDEHSDRVEAMLRRWLQTQKDRATVSRLAKACANSGEFAAVAAIQP